MANLLAKQLLIHPAGTECNYYFIRAVFMSFKSSIQFLISLVFTSMGILGHCLRT